MTCGTDYPAGQPPYHLLPFVTGVNKRKQLVGWPRRRVVYDFVYVCLRFEQVPWFVTAEQLLPVCLSYRLVTRA